MPEARKKVSPAGGDIGLEGFEQIFDGATAPTTADTVTISGTSSDEDQVARLLTRLTELIGFSVDQRMENARMAGQLIENQRQLIATQQILIRLMEKSIELTKHISAIEEKLPIIYELPRIVESLQDRLVRMEGIELD